MSNCYKSFPAAVTYSDLSVDNIYGNSASLDEGIELEHSLSLGIKGSSSVFNKKVPQGSLTIDSYLINDLNIFNQLKGSNDQNITVHLGPYYCPSPCVLSSMSIDINIGEPVVVQRRFEYFGGVAQQSPPEPISPELNPVIAENISLSGFSNVGSMDPISSISWNFNQSYSTHYLLGNTTPVIVFSQGEIQVDVNGEGFPNRLTNTAGQSCVTPPQDYTISMLGCGGQDLGSLNINGYLMSRSSSVSSEQDETNTATIIQYL